MDLSDPVDAAALRMFNETSAYIRAIEDGGTPVATAMVEATEAYRDAVGLNLKGVHEVLVCLKCFFDGTGGTHGGPHIPARMIRRVLPEGTFTTFEVRDSDESYCGVRHPGVTQEAGGEG
jgi:hypothetical protein